MPKRFAMKRVLVTGASRGIGSAIAHAFADEGGRIAVHYHHQMKQAQTVLQGLTGEGHALVNADVGDPQSCKQLISDVMQALGGIDILINNAGLYLTRPFDAHDYDSWQSDWNRMLATNLAGPANLCFLAAREMIKQASAGSIVNISSRGAFRGEPTSLGYGASKAGLNALSQSLAQALAPHRIAVSVVAPGWVETDMTNRILSGPEGQSRLDQSPLRRAARPEEVAAAVLYLASPEATYASGAIIDINGASYLRS